MIILPYSTTLLQSPVVTSFQVDTTLEGLGTWLGLPQPERLLKTWVETININKHMSVIVKKKIWLCTS
jgi:hypothetical protein